MSKYQYTEDMDELSGFGGSYEAACRAMAVAGLEWLDAHPQADPHFSSYKNIYGLISEDNSDAEALSKAVLAAPFEADGKKTTVREYGATGAMHQGSISHILWIRKNGWERYVEESKVRAKR